MRGPSPGTIIVPKAPQLSKEANAAIALCKRNFEAAAAPASILLDLRKIRFDSNNRRSEWPSSARQLEIDIALQTLASLEARNTEPTIMHKDFASVLRAVHSLHEHNAGIRGNLSHFLLEKLGPEATINVAEIMAKAVATCEYPPFGSGQTATILLQSETKATYTRPDQELTFTISWDLQKDETLAPKYRLRALLVDLKLFLNLHDKHGSYSANVENMYRNSNAIYAACCNLFPKGVGITDLGVPKMLIKIAGNSAFEDFQRADSIVPHR